VVKKLPVPWFASASFGAVADGAVVLNEAMVHGLGLHKEALKPIVDEARQEADHWHQTCERERPEPEIAGKCAIVIDDGVASGYTMMAAIKYLRGRGASRVVAASPVTSRFASTMVSGCADECVFEIVSPTLPFSIDDFYLTRNHLSEEDMLAALRES
jgi:putative phosphoribosyl transferase